MKILKRFLTITLAILLASGIFIPTALDAQRVRRVPVWYYYSHFRNPNPAAADSSGHFVLIFNEFFDEQVRPAARGNASQFVLDYGVSAPVWPAVNTQLDQGTRQAMQEAFASDSVRHVFPFSTYFFDHRIEQIPAFHYWVMDDSEGIAGLYNPVQGIAIGVRYGGDCVAETAAHEFAHSLGLNEHLAHAFDEIISGWMLRPSWPFDDFRHRLYRSTAMDMVLMELAGPVAFWQAVFWSEDRYRELWQQYLEDFVPYETMQLARAGHEFVLYNSRYRMSFSRATGRADYEDTCDISRAFFNAFDTNLSHSRRDHYARIAQDELNSIADWARHWDLLPYRSHLGLIETRILIAPR